MISRIVHDARGDALYRAQISRVRSALSRRERWRVDIERSLTKHPPTWSVWKRSKTFEDESEASYQANLILDSLTYIEEST
ncbi:MAG: hypothetical protein ACR2PK_04380 [Acidimicrobiales bacterium]